MPKALVATDRSGTVFAPWFGALHAVDLGALAIGLVLVRYPLARGWGPGLVMGGFLSLVVGDAIAVLIQASHAGGPG